MIRDHRSLDAFTYTFGVIGRDCCSCRSLPGIGQTINGARLWVETRTPQLPAGRDRQSPHRGVPGLLPNARKEVLAVATRRLGPIRLPEPRYLGPCWWRGSFPGRAVHGAGHGIVPAVLRHLRDHAVDGHRSSRRTCCWGSCCSPPGASCGLLSFARQPPGRHLAPRARPEQGPRVRLRAGGPVGIRDGHRRHRSGGDWAREARTSSRSLRPTSSSPPLGRSWDCSGPPLC